jgi:phosphoglycerate kinase
MAKQSIRDIDLKNKMVFMRVDFNVPLAPGTLQITSDKRIRASLPTIQFALQGGAGLILASHLGRPKGRVNPDMSLKPVAARLAELLPGVRVIMAPDCIGPEVPPAKSGQIVLLENLRFHPEEERNEREFAKQLAYGVDIYVNDAFGSAHRAHASTVGMVEFVPVAVPGLLMEKELAYLNKVTKNPEHPCIAILGGAKVSDKIEVIRNLLKFADKLLIGGAMAYTFMRAKGEPTGKSLVEQDKIELAKDLLAQYGEKILLPVDHIVTSELKPGADAEVVTLIPGGKMGVDIGPRTIGEYTAVIRTAKTIIWNGPMGVFETPPFDNGTVALAGAVAESGAVSVVGGGDSEKAIKSAGVADQISHISTGGGASLEFLAGIELPGVAVLPEKR